MKTRKLTKTLLTKKNFWNWLSQFSDRKIISKKGYGCDTCPLAAWLTNVTGTEYSVSGVDIWTPDTDGFLAVAFMLPQWARAFVANLDQTYRYDNITVNRALKVLG